MRLGDVGNEPKAMTGRKIEKEHTVDMGLQSVRCGVLFTVLWTESGFEGGLLVSKCVCCRMPRLDDAVCRVVISSADLPAVQEQH
ncbi:hypothetical protein L6452_32953 [Arctium lappa]|uniref:Uncharacterized protein n=1 Tax=Arctium lappa TaxID=4217 RepID=A0ACB8Z6Y3_ARCLA|nr:hypothetical protein L6452_32953 [Arctium lappa]